MTTITQQESSLISSSGVKHFPLVHVLTSKTENELEKDKNEPFNFEKTIKFLNDPHSVNQNVRFENRQTTFSLGTFNRSTNSCLSKTCSLL